MPNAQMFWRKKIVWHKVETTYGVDPTPTSALNGIEVRNMSLTPLKLKKVDQGVVQPFLGQMREMAVGQEVQLEFDVAIAGSGTAGVAPAYGGLLRCCKRSETALAAPVTGTATAGSATTLTLAAGASATDDVYRNMEITATGGTGSGQTAIIKSYNGTTKVAIFFEAVTTPFDATTAYSIGAQVVYSPVDSGDDSGTFYAYADRLKFILLGCRGNVVRTLEPLKVPVYTFTFTGLWGGYADVSAMPLDTVFTSWKAPLAVNAVNTGGFKLHGFATNLYSYSVDDGNQVVHRDDIVGVEDVIITDRKATGSVEVQAPLKSEHDFYAAAGVGGGAPADGSLTIQHGTAAGNTVRFYEPAVTVSEPGPGDRQGLISIKMSLRIMPVAPGGNDSIIIVK